MTERWSRVGGNHLKLCNGVVNDLKRMDKAETIRINVVLDGGLVQQNSDRGVDDKRVLLFSDKGLKLTKTVRGRPEVWLL